MKTCTKCKESKTTGEFSIDRSRKDGRYPHCKFCSYAAARVWRANNTDSVRARAAKYYAANSDKIRPRNAAHQSANPEISRARQAKWRVANRNRSRAISRLAAVKYYAGHKAECTARVLARQSKIKQQTPAWANFRYMNLFYKLAKIETARTGRAVHVDHIYPINSDWVCGLHVEHNMQLMFDSDNKAKGNRRSAHHEAGSTP